MIRQTIRIFYEVKNGVVNVVRTDPVLTPLTMKEKKKGGGMDAEGTIKSGAKKAIQT